jgi:serine/threonine protein kinase/tetratricopeptide (TPR) repeat protein
MNKVSLRTATLFADALALPESERARFVDGVAAGDLEMIARLKALLVAHGSSENLLPPALPNDLAVAPDMKAGDRVGRYNLLQKLGEGGCGVVYLAEQVEPVRRRVALKIIKLGMDTKAVIARFSAERQALALMDHPNIAKVLDAGATDSGRPFFVMELVRGTPITQFCDDNNLSTPDRLQLFMRVCAAIQHAHERGIVHRDIKPSNILVTANDRHPTPKVIDFGIAKATQGRLTDDTLFTAFEQFMGTPVYMSPEQAEISGVEIDGRSDIYSLGVLLYALLTGRPPIDPQIFSQGGVEHIRQCIRDAEPSKPSTLLRALTEEERTTIARRRGTIPAQLSVALRGDLDWVVMKALEKNRSRRYQAVSAFADDVQRHLEHRPVTARPPSAAYLARKYVRRHRVGFAAAAMCMTALVTGVVLTRWHARYGSATGFWGEVGSNPSIAVLAFKNLTGVRENEYLSDGISDEVRNVLTKVVDLRVAARTSAFHFRGQNVPAAVIAEKLGVQYLVDGTVQKHGDDVRISVQLINAATGYELWSDHFDRPLLNLFSLQDEIASEIAEILQLKLAEGPSRAAVGVNPEARRLVLQGRHQWNLRNEDPTVMFVAFGRAEAAFTKALSLAPNFAEAHSGIAEVCVTRANFRQFDDAGETKSDVERAKAAAQRAIQLDPTLAEPHAVLGFAARLEGRLEEAERHFTKAVALNPKSAVIQNWYALLLACRGKLDAANDAYARAASSDPLWFLNLNRQAWHLARAGRAEDALRISEKAAALQKDVHIPNRADQAFLLWQLGRIDEAVEVARRVTQLPDKEPRWQADSDVIWVLRRAGFEQEAIVHAEVALRKWPINSYNRGFVLGALGRFDEALPYLEHTPAVAARGLFWDPMWDAWRNDPRFTALMVKLKRLEDYKVARAVVGRIAPRADVSKSGQTPPTAARE